MATTNFLQFNPSAINQETDAQYLIDALRVGGAPVDGILPSNLTNKAWAQWSTFIAAFCGALLNKGLSTSDADLGVLEAVLANVIIASDLPIATRFVPSSPTPELDANKTSAFFLPLSQNEALAITNLNFDGQQLLLVYQQDGAGGRTITFPGNFVGAIQPDPFPGAVSMQAFYYYQAGNLLISRGPLTSTTGATFFSGGDLVSPARLLIAQVIASGLIDAGLLKVAGAAPNGQVLTGNGTTYVPVNPQSVMTRSADLAGSRAFGAAVTNTSGKPMFVSGTVQTAGSSTGSLACLVGTGTPTEEVFGMEATATVSGAKIGFFFCVPAGDSYVLNNTGAVNAISSLYEQTIT